MRNNRFRIVTLLLSVLALTNCIAFSEVIKPNYIAISNLSCSIRVVSGKIECVADVTQSYADYTSHLSAILERSKNGQNWTIVESWSASGSGVFGATIAEDVTATSGYKFRLFVRATIKNGRGIVVENASKYSRIIEY